LVAEAGPEEEYFSRRFADLLHVGDEARLEVWGAVAQDPTLAYRAPAVAAMALQMLAYQIDGRHEQKGAAAAFVERLHAHLGIADELRALTGLLQARTTLPGTPLPGLEDTPLVLHAGYGICEVLTAVEASL
jgi:hypothetical protein